jgi:hypothetical protein
MKKTILITIAAVSISGYSIAQTSQTTSTVVTETVPPKPLDSRSAVAFGAKAGGNYSNVYNTSGASFHSDAKFGFAGGAFIAIPIGQYLGIQPELLYSQKGFMGTGSILGSQYSITRTSSYLDVPIFAALKPTEFITILAGPQYSYLLKQRDVFENGVTTIAQEQEFKNDNIRKNILGFVAGFDISMKSMVLSARAGWDLQANNGDGSSSTPRYKNYWYQATIGFRLYK